MNTFNTIAAITSSTCHVIDFQNCLRTEDNDISACIYDGIMLEDSNTLYEQFVTLTITKSQQQECISFAWRNSFHMSAVSQLTIDSDCTTTELKAILHRIEDDFC